MGSEIDFGLFDAEIINAEEKLLMGDFHGGMGIILNVSRRIKDATVEGLNDDTKLELQSLFTKCAGIMVEAAENLVSSESLAFDPTKELPGMIESLILKPDDELFFEDLVGMHDAKVALIESVVLPFAIPELVAENQRWTGALLFGASGCGKSKVLKALINTVNKKMDLNITFVNLSLADVLGNFHGDTERNMSKIFAASANLSPCVILMDEIDSLAGDRNMANHHADVKMINHFLSVMDGIQGRSRVVLIGTTNKPHNLDTAFLRRFHKKIYVELPDTKARGKILQTLVSRLQKLRIDSDINFDELAGSTYGYSPSDLNALVASASQKVKCRGPAQQLLKRLEGASSAIKLNGLVHAKLFRALTMADLEEARKDISASNKAWDVSKLEKFARDYCPKQIDLGAIQSDCSCCRLSDFRANPFLACFMSVYMCMEFCQGC